MSDTVQPNFEAMAQTICSLASLDDLSEKDSQKRIEACLRQVANIAYLAGVHAATLRTVEVDPYQVGEELNMVGTRLARFVKAQQFTERLGAKDSGEAKPAPVRCACGKRRSSTDSRVSGVAAGSSLFTFLGFDSTSSSCLLRACSNCGAVYAVRGE